MKKDIHLNRAKWLVEPGCIVLVTSGTMENPNVMTLSWQTPVNSTDPCLVLLVMNHIRYSYDLIKQNGQLAINIPGEDLLEETHFVGTVSGRNIEKFRKSRLTAIPAKLVEPPLIRECAGHLECKIAEIVKREEHDLLICEVLRALADEVVFDGGWIPEKFHTLHYIGGNRYGVMARTVTAPR